VAAIELTGSQQRDLDALDAPLQDLMQNLHRAELAGLDVSELQRQVAAIQNKRRGLLTHFSPTATTRTRRQ
jgi:hypothetical protein